MADTIQKLVEIIIQLKNEDALLKIQDFIKHLNALETSSKGSDKGISQLSKDLDTLSKRILPGLDKAFNDVVNTQKKFLTMEEKKIDVLKRLGSQAKETGDTIRRSLSFGSVDFTSEIKSSLATLKSSISGMLGGALIGGIIGNKGTTINNASVNNTSTTNNVQPVEVPSKVDVPIESAIAEAQAKADAEPIQIKAEVKPEFSPEEVEFWLTQAKPAFKAAQVEIQKAIAANNEELRRVKELQAKEEIDNYAAKFGRDRVDAILKEIAAEKELLKVKQDIQKASTATIARSKLQEEIESERQLAQEVGVKTKKLANEAGTAYEDMAKRLSMSRQSGVVDFGLLADAAKKLGQAIAQNITNMKNVEGADFLTNIKPDPLDFEKIKLYGKAINQLIEDMKNVKGADFLAIKPDTTIANLKLIGTTVAASFKDTLNGIVKKAQEASKKIKDFFVVSPTLVGPPTEIQSFVTRIKETATAFQNTWQTTLNWLEKKIQATSKKVKDLFATPLGPPTFNQSLGIKAKTTSAFGGVGQPTTPIAPSKESIGLWQSLNKEVGNVYGSILNLKTLIATAFATYGIAGIAKQFVEISQAAEQTRLRLSILFKSTAEGNKVFKDLQDYALKTGVSLQDLSDSTEILATLQGTTTKDIQNMYKAATDIASFTGISVKDSAEQIQRMWSAGAGAAQRFREKGVTQIMGFSRNAELSIAETQDKLRKLFAGEDQKAAFTGLMGSAETMGNTFEKMIQKLINYWKQFVLEVMDNGVFAWLKAALQVVSKELDAVGIGTEDWGNTVKKVSSVIIKGLEYVVKAIGMVREGYTLLKVGGNSVMIAFGYIAEKINEFFSLATAEVMKLLKVGLDAYQKTAYALHAISEEDLIDTSTLDMKLVMEKNVQYWKNFQEQARLSADLAAADMGKSLNETDKFFKDIQDQLKLNTEEQKKYNKTLEETKQKQLEIKAVLEKQRNEAKTPREKFNVELNQLDPGTLQRSRAITDDLKRQMETQLNISEEYFAQGKLGLEKYYAERKDLITKALAEESLLLEKQAQDATLTNPEQAAKYYSELEALRAASNSKLIALEQDKATKEKAMFDAEYSIWQFRYDTKESFALTKEAELIAKEREIRLTGIEESAQAEQEALYSKYEQDLLTFEEFLIARQALEVKYEGQKEAVIVSSENRMEKKRQETFDMYLTATRTNAAAIEDAFTNLYEATGKKIKAFFYLAKAAAIAQTIISTYEAASNAVASYSQLGPWGVAAGIAIAGVIVAGGLARVATIASQNLAEGGEVQGVSASDKSDNIKANLTAGEYVMPVRTVRHYGLGAMEAMRRQAVARDVFGSNNFSIQKGSKHFAAGGLVSSSSGQQNNKSTIELTNVNVLDVNELNSWAGTKPFETATLNVMSRNIKQVKQIINQ